GELVNIYGPTETTLVKTCRRIPGKPDYGPQSAGLPLPDTQIIILNGSGKLCALGEPGEIIIRTPFACDGYLNAPQEEALRFIPNPLRDDAADIVYRTGDRGVYRIDGQLQVLGRMDNQVKIRGVRVELGEVEAVLARHALVAESAVGINLDRNGEKRLTGYLTGPDLGGQGAEIFPPAPAVLDELRSWLSRRLTDAMIPTRFVGLKAMPLLPNGKLNRKALPHPDQLDAGPTLIEHVAPATATEETLCAVWAEVLGLDKVSAEDDFFQLGGHSLLAIQVITRLRDPFKVRVPLPVLFENTTPRKLGRWLDSETAEVTDVDAVRPVPRDGDLPLSYGQERFWFMDRLEGRSATYTIASAYRLNGSLDAAAFGRAVDRLIHRHEALRTRFITVEGRPVQAIDTPHIGALRLIDLSGLPRSEEIPKAIASAEAGLPFDLTRGPLFRVRLLRLDVETHVLTLSLHHIIADGWSMGVLIKELTAAYHAELTGEAAPLPKLEVQYADFAHWQRRTLSGDNLTARLDWWRQYLYGAPTLLELPTDRPRPAMQTYRGAIHSFGVEAEVVNRLRALCTERGATLFMMLHAAFSLLLARFSGGNDILTGTPVANRERKEIEPLIGLFINTLVLRCRIDGDETFEHMLARHKTETLETFSRQDVPFELIVEAVQPERDLSHSPLFQVLFVLQNTPGSGDLSLPGLTLAPQEAPHGTARFDLSLAAVETGDALVASFEYNTDLFDASTAKRLGECWRRLLASIAEDPGRAVDRLDLLDDTARTALLEDWNRTERPVPAQPVHSLIAARAARNPEQPALIFGETTLTYERLTKQAFHVAGVLREKGVRNGEAVGIYLERSPEMVVGLLGILTSGATYVPMDPGFPKARIAAMLEDARPRLVLSTQADAAGLPDTQAEIIHLDRPAEADAPPEDVDFGNAYTIYTSGSTGKPKGVTISHHALVNFLASMSNEPGISADDCLLAVTTISFDIAGLELYLPLMTGARIVLATREQAADGKALIDMIDTHEATVMQATPATWRSMLDSGWQGAPNLTILCGGEALPRNLAAELLTRGKALWNLYGPTETTIWSAVRRITDAGSGDAAETIGRPIANTRLHVLDRHMQPVPIGVAGQLFIGGAGLAAGYHNRPALTAAVFVPDPFSKHPGDRLYATGDLVRYLADGNIAFLGRIDHQVKLRGFRIELGEIEAALTTAEPITQAVVTLHTLENDAMLVAYLTADGEPDESLLRNHLRGRLPDYMIPAVFVTLDRFPLTPNGKIDRKVLPAPQRSTAAATHVAPRNRIEAELASIWAELLHLERVSVDADFFELGGHSLLATRLVSRIREIFDVELPLRDIFAAGTLANLAEAVSAAEGVVQLPPVGPRDPQQPPVLTHAQQRMWFLDLLERMSAESHVTAYNIPGVLRLQGPLRTDALEAVLTTIVNRHETLRTVVTQDTGTPAPLIRPIGKVHIPFMDLSGLSAENALAAAQLAAIDKKRPFLMAEGPLYRVYLIRLAQDDHVFLFNTHHIISDGWSTGILVRELVALYDKARLLEKPSAEQLADVLAPLPIQYTDYAAWQQQWLSGEALEAQITFWRNKLEGIDPLLQLPTDRPRPAVMRFVGTTHDFHLPADFQEKIQALGRQTGSTGFMVMEALFASLLARYSGSDDIVVGTPIANRTRAEIESLIGFFVNTIVLRNDLSGSPNLAELVNRTKRTALEAYAHQDAPFEQVVDAVQPERDMGRTPVFQVMFSLQNAPEEHWELPGFTLAPMPGSHNTAKFDLTLMVNETPGGYACAFEYNTDLFDRGTIARMAEHFKTLAIGALASPESPVDHLPLLTKAEREQMLHGWNSTLWTYPRRQGVHDLVRQTAQRNPDAVALTTSHPTPQTLTYEALLEGAEQLAAHLCALGAGPDTPIAVMIDRSPNLIRGLLGILLSGAAYVPLDPNDPGKRLTGIFEDLRFPVVLTTTAYKDRLPQSGAHVICLDTFQPTGMRQNLPEYEIDGNSLAAIMHTSGSTGKPKGVQVTHRGMLRLFYSNDYAQDLHTMMQLAQISFDASTLEIWGPLINGGKVVIFADRVPSTADLGMELARNAVDTLWLTSTLFNLVIEDDPTVLSGLTRLLFGGEAASQSHVRRARQALPHVQLFNGYGPTESATFTTVHAVEDRDDSRNAIPIGRPINHTRVYVVDLNLIPVPVGVSGELLIGGDGLARGYANRPSLTAERFIPNPFGDAGERLYRTGDLVRYLPDGSLDFVGRMDFQVKLRGFRIELGEIESVFSEAAGVAHAVATVREDVPGNRRLVVYLVADTLDPLSETALRTFAARRLPEFMMPANLVFLENLPLKATGKVDLKALPSPESLKQDVREFVAPRDELERTVAAVWQEVLGAEKVSLTDNFFELGGQSLLATRVIARLRDELGVEVTLQILFSARSLGSLCEQIRILKDRQSGGLPPLTPTPRDDRPLQVSFAQQRIWFLDRMEDKGDETGGTAFAIPFPMRLRGPVALPQLEAALSEIIRRHEVLRTVFEVVEGLPVQVIQPPYTIDMPVIDLRHLPEAERLPGAEQLSALEARKRFDLARGPLLRTTLVRLDDRDHVLLATLHHIVSDGWSTEILTRELSQLYLCFLAEQPSPLPDLQLQYADFAAWQRSWLDSDMVDSQMGWWREHFSGELPALRLPTDAPMSAASDPTSAYVNLRIEVDLLERLRAFSRGQEATLFMTLLSTFKLLMQRYSGQDDIVIGTPVAGRGQSEVEPLIGCFLNLLALRDDLSGNPSFLDLLGRVRETVLGAFAHGEVPFEKLVEEVQPERNLNRHPLFDILFNLINTPEAALDLTGLRLEPMPKEDPEVKLPITLYMTERTHELNIRAVYQDALFSEARMSLMLRHYRNLLAQVCADPEKPIADYVLADDETRALLPDPSIALEVPGFANVADQVAGRALETPDHTAVVWGGEVWTYSRLLGAADHLAAVMTEAGLQREDVIAVHGTRSFGFIAAMLSAFRAGAVLLNLDPRLPLARRELLLTETKARLILDLAGNDDLQGRIIAVDPKTGRTDRDAGNFLPPKLNGADPAYIFFTSGTTGKPKGILGCQRGLSHFLDWQRREAGIGPQDRAAQLSNLSFDAVLRDVFLPLSVGAQLHLPPEDAVLDGTRLIPWLAESAITLFNTVPSLLASWLTNAPKEGDLLTLRHIFLAGEPLNQRLVRAWCKRFGNETAIVNMYGTTETTLAKTFYRVPASPPPGNQPGGKALPQSQALVLSADLRPCGLGEMGEIYIRTPFRTLGYLGDVDAANWVVNPHTQDPDDLLYRTGDRGRFYPDGNLEVLGRVDFQVKVRGVRVEPGEIEALLTDHEAVTETAVIARPDGRGDNRLLAYVVVNIDIDAGDLRRYLAARLPEAMVPAAVTLLDAFPLTPNGKIDRKALPAPERADEAEI
ncbi:MAG: amino acid adenylation domain-containing protein, partial [Acidobacteriota bacterium]|nr:amino acid adenylation domain-containing protein [Acidobacteriota bacterium]